MPWVFDPQSGGIKVPARVQDETRRRILDYAKAHYHGKYTRLDIRFRGPLCYIDAYQEPDLPPNWPPTDLGISREEHLERLRNTPLHLCRLRYFSENRWGASPFTRIAMISTSRASSTTGTGLARRKRRSTLEPLI